MDETVYSVTARVKFIVRAKDFNGAAFSVKGLLDAGLSMTDGYIERVVTDIHLKYPDYKKPKETPE